MANKADFERKAEGWGCFRGVFGIAAVQSEKFV
jgi:hypothetical protein